MGPGGLAVCRMSKDTAARIGGPVPRSVLVRTRSARRSSSFEQQLDERVEVLSPAASIAFSCRWSRSPPRGRAQRREPLRAVCRGRGRGPRGPPGGCSTRGMRCGARRLPSACRSFLLVAQDRFSAHEDSDTLRLHHYVGVVAENLPEPGDFPCRSRAVSFSLCRASAASTGSPSRPPRRPQVLSGPKER